MERRLKGFKDFLPNESAMRDSVCEKIMLVAKSYGFHSIATPSLEYAETLFGFGGTDKEVYAFKDHGGRDVGLRFDLTVPFARYVSENFNDLHFPFKKIQIGEVFRGEKPQRGRYRQFCQADFDIVGSDDGASDLEIILVMREALKQILGEKHAFCFRLNSRKLLDRLMLEHFGHNDAAIYTLVDKLDKIGDQKFLDSLNAQYNKDASVLLKALRGDVRSYEEAKDLIYICDAVPEARIDACIARGLGYYTGMVFETTLVDDEAIGSIASGGRYGDLVSRFAKHNLSGVGGSIGVDRLISAVELKAEPTFRLFVATGTGTYTFAASLADRLRKALCDAVVDVNVKDSKLGQQFKLADKSGADFVLVIGEDEVKNSSFTIKNLAKGTQDTVSSFDECLKYLETNRT
jgi:histidyl-tRNA synthetase